VHGTPRSNVAEDGGSSGSGALGGSCEQANSDPVVTPETSLSDQSSSPSDEAFQRSVNKPGLTTSSQSDVQPGPSRWSEEKSASVSHGTSSHAGDASGSGISKDRPSATPHGTKRKADTHTGPSTGGVCPGTSREPGSSHQTQRSPQHETTTTEVKFLHC